MSEYSKKDAEKALELLRKMKEEKEKPLKDLLQEKSKITNEKLNLLTEKNARKMIEEVVEKFGEDEIEPIKDEVDLINKKIFIIDEELHDIDIQIKAFEKSKDGLGLIEINEKAESICKEYNLQELIW